MKYKIFKLHFTTGVHVGKGMLSDAEGVFHADTLFSALCHEALQFSGGIESLYEKCKSGRIRFSDGLPYVKDTLYIPKPFLTFDREDDGNSVKKKAFKKLKYIPFDQINRYLEGNLDAVSEVELLKQLGQNEMRTNVMIKRGEGTEPYYVGIYHFGKQNGLYVCGVFADEQEERYFSTLLEAVGATGIGGKRSSGLGKFYIEEIDCPEDLIRRFTGNHYKNYISLSISLPQPEEMEIACEGSHYLLLQRSGFVSSSNYAETFRKKRTIYSFAPGSCVQNRYHGDIYDVSCGGNHAVYRYGLPLFLGVKE